MSQQEDTKWIINRIAEAAEKACTKSQSALKAKESSDFEEAVPKIRNNFKEIRAAFRLVRDKNKNYKKENEFFRDQAKKILDVQKAIAMVKSLDLINEQYSDRLYKNAFTELRDKLKNFKKEEIESTMKDEHIFQDMRQKLDGRCENLKDVLSIEVSRETIESGIKRVYSRGRKAQKELSDSQTNDDFHELQKRANYLRIQLGLLSPIWPQYIDVWKSELERLSHLLETSEGLYQLSGFLQENEDMSNNKDGVYLMNTLIEGHREQVQQHAMLLSRKIFSLKSKSFITLISSAWDAYAVEGKKQIMPSEKLQLSQ